MLLTDTALKDSSKRSINSDWKIELPGEFELAGTTVRYVRRGLWEKMSAKGPTKTPLHLMVKPLASVGGLGCADMCSSMDACPLLAHFPSDVAGGFPSVYVNAHASSGKDIYMWEIL